MQICRCNYYIYRVNRGLTDMYLSPDLFLEMPIFKLKLIITGLIFLFVIQKSGKFYSLKFKLESVVSLGSDMLSEHISNNKFVVFLSI